MSTLHVLFKVGSADYVVPAADVREMESFEDATRIPGTAAHIRGLVRIRGRVVPVIDLRARFGLSELDLTLDSRVIVVRHDGRDVGLLADSAREVLEIDADRFEPTPEVVGEQSGGLVSSIVRVDERLLMRINLHRVIGSDASESGSLAGHADAPEKRHWKERGDG